jgi:hypothetical protein
MAELPDRVEEMYEWHKSKFETSSPNSLENLDEENPGSARGRATSAYHLGMESVLLEKDDWRDWFAKSARYRLHELELFEAEQGKLRAVEYDNALCAAILSEYDEIIDEVIAGINQMPDEIHDLGNVHGEVVRDTLRCQVALIEGNEDATDRWLVQAKETFEEAAAEDGLELVEFDRTDRFPATFQFIEGVRDDDKQALEDGIQQLLDWHEQELFQDGASEYFAHWPAMYIVLAQHFGYEIRPDHRFLPQHFLDAIGTW